MTDHPASSWRDDLLLVAIAIMLLFVITLGGRPYLNPSEARYIEIPRQMLATGDWLTPRINGVPYYEKPPLFFWLQALVMKQLGTGEFAGRLATALLSTLTCLTTYAIGRMLHTRLTGLLSAGVLATSLLGFGMGHIAGLDVPLTFFTTLAIGAFLLAQRLDGRRRRAAYWLFSAATALAVMTKGLLGVALPAIVIIPWLLLTRKHILRDIPWVTGSLIFLAITLPWHLLMMQAHPEFFDFYVIHEHFERFTTNEHHRNAPWWFFLAIATAGLMPWTGFVPATWRSLRASHWHTRPETAFLCLWVLLPLLFFSLSHSKLTAYIFPIFPPLAILIGHTLTTAWQGGLPLKTVRRAALLPLLAYGSVVPAVPLLMHLGGKAAGALAFLPEVSTFLLLPLATTLLLLAAIVIARKSAALHIAALAMLGAASGITLDNVVAQIDRSGIKPLTYFMEPGYTVVAYDSYWQDLPVYLGSNVYVAGWQGELAFGIAHHPETRQWMITNEQFWEGCQTNDNLYVLIREETYASLAMPQGCTLKPLVTFGTTLLLTKIPNPAAKP